MEEQQASSDHLSKTEMTSFEILIRLRGSRKMATNKKRKRWSCPKSQHSTGWHQLHPPSERGAKKKEDCDGSPATSSKDQGIVCGPWAASTHDVLPMPSNQPLAVLTWPLNEKFPKYYSIGRPCKKNQVMNLNLK